MASHRMGRRSGRWLGAWLVAGAALAALLGLVVPDQTAHAAGACSVGAGAHLTINSATTDAACTSVTVPAGTFSEQVIINHPLTLTGSGAGSTILKYPVTITTPALNGQSDFVVLAQSAGVTISSFTVDGANFNCNTPQATNVCGGATFMYGVILGAGGITVDHVTIQHVGAAGGPSANGTTGVGIGGGASNGATVLIQNSTVQGIIGPAMQTGFTGTPVRFLGNHVIGASNSGGADGVFAGDVVAGNTFENFHMTGTPPNFAAGAIADTALVVGGGAQVTNNTFTNTDNAIVVSDSQSADTISGNTFTHTQTAIAAAGNYQAPQTISDNTINDTYVGGWGEAPGTAIALCRDEDDSVTGNTITGSAQYGIHVYSQHEPGCLSPAPGSIPTSRNTISRNSISGSGVADIRDSTSGGAGTSGTANSYAENTCAASDPPGLCVPPAGAGSTPASQPTTSTTATAKATVSPRPTVTGTTTAVPARGLGGATGAPPASGPSPLLVVLVTVVALLLSAGGVVGFVMLRGRRARKAAYTPVMQGRKRPPYLDDEPDYPQPPTPHTWGEWQSAPDDWQPPSPRPIHPYDDDPWRASSPRRPR
jgi:copper-binding protein NosD